MGLSSLVGNIPSVLADVVAKPGDTLWSIARANHTTVSALLKANPELHGQQIQIGQRLHIPGLSGSPQSHSAGSHVRLTYTVQTGDTLWSIAHQFHVTVTQLQLWNPTVDGDLVKAGMTLTLHPSNKVHTQSSGQTIVSKTSSSRSVQTPPRAAHLTQSSSQGLSSRGSGFSPQPAPPEEQNLYWMAHVIYAEAHDSPLRAQIAVGDVVLHRLESSPGSTVHDIVFAQSGGHYQFSTVATDAIYANPDSSSVQAATAVLVKHEEVVPGAYYFYDNGSVSKDSWIAGRPVVASFDGFVFAK